MYLPSILAELNEKKGKYQAFIPSIWSHYAAGKKKKVDYADFVGQKMAAILEKKKAGNVKSTRNWTAQAVIYNMFVRLFSAYDHDGDGIIGGNFADITLNSKGLRETGTFLKAIALLPYLKYLGINTIHLLPVTEIGIRGRKGNLGSPYAIKNPYKLDPTLADPCLEHHSVDHQYKAFVEAAHHLGMRVVQEFIFRTAAIDSDWAQEHPEWFYWIKQGAKYGAPSFTAQQLKRISKVPEGKGEFIAPDRTYRDLFFKPPQVNHQHDLKVASAFADWPPDDLQPPWSDVTYLRMFTYPFQKQHNFNYIAYNTIRYYDPKLAQPDNTNAELWDKITRIIPYFQEKFGIDGAMIDMGHALPNKLKRNIIREARKKDKNFAFWDENFENKASTEKEGYNAVIGDTWYSITKRNGFKKLIRSAEKKQPLHFFGTAETHNSPRFGFGQQRKKQAAWLLFNLLPGAIPFMHNGFELNEKLPVNTGLNFSKKEIAFFSKQNLPLFYKNKLKWDSRSNSIAFIRKTAVLKKSHPWLFMGRNLTILQSDNDKITGFVIRSTDHHAVVLFNVNFKNEEPFHVPNDIRGDYLDLLSGKSTNLSGHRSLSPGSLLLLVRTRNSGR